MGRNGHSDYITNMSKKTYSLAKKEPWAGWTTIKHCGV